MHCTGNACPHHNLCLPGVFYTTHLSISADKRYTKDLHTAVVCAAQPRTPAHTYIALLPRSVRELDTPAHTGEERGAW